MRKNLRRWITGAAREACLPHPEQGHRAYLGIARLAGSYGAARVVMCHRPRLSGRTLR